MKPSSQSGAWTEAVRRDDSVERQRFLEVHIDLVRYVALRIATRLPLSVEFDDLVHDGIVGLLDAVQKFNPTRNVRFRTYAERRVRGAILDGLRHRDWQPRTVRRGQRELDRAMTRLSSRHGRPATEEELADALNFDLPRLRQLLRDTNVGSPLPFDHIPHESEAPSAQPTEQPHAALERKELLECLAQELQHIPERESRVLELYYHEGLNMREVGAVLGVTESRVCQLHAQAAARLRAALRSRLSATAQPVGSGGRV